MDVDLLVVGDRPIALLRILTTCMVEEACSHGFTDCLEVFTANPGGLNWQSEPICDLNELLLCVMGALQGTALDEVVETPSCGAVLLLPGVIYVEQCEMVAIWMVEFGLLLIS